MNIKEFSSKGYLQVVSDTLPAFVSYVDLEERFQFINRRYAEWLGISPNEIIGSTVQKILGEELYEKANPYIKRALDGEYVCYDRLSRSAHGEERLFQIEYTPDVLSNRMVRGFVMHGQDVTELRTAIHTRESFLSVASNELRSPLTAMKLRIQLFQRALTQGNPSSQQMIGGLINQSFKQLDRLERLVEDMLDISGIESETYSLNLERLDLTAVVKDVIKRMETHFGDNQIRITQDLQPGILGNFDRYRIEQIITNLMVNALKFGEAQPVLIRTIQVDDKAHLEIIDQGRGTTEEDQLLFDSFDRLSLPYYVGGLGLGLLIARQITQAHGGYISVKSPAGKGSIFTVTFPLAS